MQSKTASLGTNTSPHRGSRGSRGDGGIDDGAVSGASVQTPFGGQKDGVSGGASGGGGGMARGEASTSGMQIPKSGICSSSICEESGEERASSHKYATTLWRCGFEWVVALLKSRLQAWDEEEAANEEWPIERLYDDPYSEKFVEVLGCTIPHIIGRGGRVIRRIEAVCGVFLTFRDLQDGRHEVFISGPRPACILAEFAIDMLCDGHHSVLTTLSSLRL